MDRPVLRRGGRVVIPSDAALDVGLVAVADVRLPDNWAAMDPRHVQDALALVQPGEHLPPVLLVRGPAGTYWLVDGRHRFLSAILAGRDQVLAVVVDRIEMRGTSDRP